MADRGFPWLAPSRDQGKEFFALKGQTGEGGSGKDPREDPVEVTNKHPPSSPSAQDKKQNHVPGKRRSGSGKAPPGSRSTTTTATTSTIPSPKSPPKEIPRLPVRTIPPWVRDAEEDDVEDGLFESALPDGPHAAFIAQHNHSPSTAGRSPLLSSQQPRRHGFTTVSGKVRREKTSRWITFARASAYPREDFNGEKVGPDWLDQNLTDYSKPWLADHDEDDAENNSSRYRAFRRKREAWYKRSQVTILRNPFIPLAFRLTVFSFALVALGLGVSIYHETERITHCINQTPRSAECQRLVGVGAQDYYQDPSGLMAIIVDAIALVYTIYITYDEYFSKPLGLRPARAKVRLVLLDLFFVVFQSANLSLSFESLTVDEGACQIGDTPQTSNRFDNLCRRARALSAVLLVSLVAWLLTFSVSVLRSVSSGGQGLDLY